MNRTLAFLLVVLEFLSLTEVALAGSSDTLLPRQGTQLPRTRAPQTTGQSVIPKSATAQGEESANILILPQAAKEFVGHWGGHLYLLSSSGGFHPQQSSPATLEFGQRSDGTVFVRTGVWGRPSDGGTHATAHVVSPQRIRIQVEHVVAEGSKALQVSQKYSLILKHKGVLDCIESAQVYDGTGTGLGYPYDRPIFSANYHGVLMAITEEEAARLQAEVLSQGYVPEAKVEGQGNFSPR